MSKKQITDCEQNKGSIAPAEQVSARSGSEPEPRDDFDCGRAALAWQLASLTRERAVTALQKLEGKNQRDCLLALTEVLPCQSAELRSPFTRSTSFDGPSPPLIHHPLSRNQRQKMAENPLLRTDFSSGSLPTQKKVSVPTNHGKIGIPLLSLHTQNFKKEKDK